ncbi:sugar phosphate nucleotidyltransferase [Candidatus Tisiphia endosymbiont of Empis tessellata]|uniref:sugar phosphate nucleotidyltransferase n=1 Tax=Candidatus Tisiphia endosymbiont of Empis tessellata TaxID=3066259 RepID=UPI00313C0055
MLNMDCQVIVLAAGNGRRMDSTLPKVMHKVGGRSMLDRVITNARQVSNEVILVHSWQLEEHIVCYKDICKFILQPEPLGTAHAVYNALDLVDDNKIVAVLYGDNPLITANIINDLLDHLISTNSAITTLCFRRDNPGQYGRIVTDELGHFLKIVEFKEATSEEQAITICNSGIMAFEAGILKKYLPTIFLGKVDRSKELYLTALVKIAKDSGEKVSYLLSSDHDIVLGVNTKQELEEANKTIAKLMGR